MAEVSKLRCFGTGTPVPC